APGPAGTSIWEYVLASEVGRRPFENLVLHLKRAIVPSQPYQLRTLIARQPIALALIDRGLLQPGVERRIGDPELLRDLRHRPLTQPRQLDCLPSKLGWIPRSHLGLLPGR